MAKQYIIEAQRLQKLAGINEIKIIPKDTPKKEPDLPSGWEIEEIEEDAEGYNGNKILRIYTLPHQTSSYLFDVSIFIEKTPEGKYYVHNTNSNPAIDIMVKYDTFSAAEEVAIADMEEINKDWEDPNEYYDDDRYIDEVKIKPVSMGGVSKIDIINQIVDYYDVDPDFYHDAGFNTKQNVKDFYSKFKTEDLVELTAMSQAIYPILSDYYKKHNRVFVDGKDYTKLYLKTVKKYS